MTKVKAFLAELLRRANLVLHEVLAFGANLFHALRGEVVTHVVQPLEADAKKIVAEVKTDVAVVEAKV